MSASACKPLDAPTPAAAEVHGDSRLLRDAGFLAVIATSALVQGSHAAYYTFASIAWQQAGFGGLTIAGLWVLGVIAEIVLFAFSPRFTLPLPLLVVIAALSAGLRWLIMAQSPPIAVLAVVQLAHGLSFGLTQVGTMGLIAQRVPGHVMARGQGYLVACAGIVTSSAAISLGRDLFAGRRGRLLPDGRDGVRRRAHHVAVAASARRSAPKRGLRRIGHAGRPAGRAGSGRVDPRLIRQSGADVAFSRSGLSAGWKSF